MNKPTSRYDDLVAMLNLFANPVASEPLAFW